MKRFLARCLVTSISLMGVLAGSMQAAVTEWGIVKSLGGSQPLDQFSATPDQFEVEIWVETEAEGDATSATVSGGGLQGAVALTYEDGEWILEQDFDSEAAMNAVFPDNTTYTLNLSGGTLGALTQTIAIGPRKYPKVPYLTGRVYSDLQHMDAAADFELGFGAAGDGVDLVIVEIEETQGEGNIVLEEDLSSSATSQVIPGDTLVAGRHYDAFVGFYHINNVSGDNGFGVAGIAARNAYNVVPFRAAAADSPTAIVGAWQFGDPAGEGSGVVVFMENGTYFMAEDMETPDVVDEEDPDSDGMERGTYMWDSYSGAIDFDTKVDTNGTIGFSHPDENERILVSGGILNFVTDEEEFGLAGVASDEDPLVGAWEFGAGIANDSGVVVFLSGGRYFHAEDGADDDEFANDGMERGTYVWSDSNLTATAIVDTNGEFGLSDIGGSVGLSLDGDELELTAGDEDPFTLNRVVAAEQGTGVAQWRVSKRISHSQFSKATASDANNWTVSFFLELDDYLDAEMVSVHEVGGSVLYSFERDFENGFEYKKSFGSKAELDAEFPNDAAFLAVVRGGVKGTSVQEFSFGGETYPNTPYLTGDDYLHLQSVRAQDSITFSFSEAGTGVTNSGEIGLRYLEDATDTEAIEETLAGDVRSKTHPAGFFDAGLDFISYLRYSTLKSISGDDGFEVDGQVAFSRETDFVISVEMSPLIGAWSFGTPPNSGSGVILFFEEGKYIHAEDALNSGSDPDGIEVGTYEWNEVSGSFSATALLDGNGSVGLSNIGESSTFSINGDSLTFNDGGESTVLTRVNASDGDVQGAWHFGYGEHGSSEAYVFLDSGTYYHIVDIFANDDVPERVGMERGTFTWDAANESFTYAVGIDTNGSSGLSGWGDDLDVSLWAKSLFVGDANDGHFYTPISSGSLNQVATEFPSAALEQAIRDALGKPTGVLSTVDLDRLTELDASGLQIEDITGLEWARNLARLDLSFNKIWYIGNLWSLDKLTHLDLSHNQIDNLTALSNLKNLVELDVSSNKLSDGAQGQGDDDIIRTFSSKPLDNTGVLAP
ncbi:leucine-rich repeat domain-containing protein, partial [Pelagicoccus mobilis]